MEINYLPLEVIEDDKLSFESKAIEIASSINEYPSYLPYSISIRGPWGSGKSTMLNFIEHYLNKEKCKVIRFNPWIITDRDTLINSLFEEIYYQIDGGLTKTKEKFIDYALKVVPSATKVATYFGAISNGVEPGSASTLSSGASESAKGVGELLFNKPLSRRKKELYEEMYRTHIGTNNKIVVMIDELDRLFPDEIITIFQMIKSALDLPGLIFIVAMDEMMIHEALENKGISRSKQYLDKIFQNNYYINTKYQLKTLVEHFLLSTLDSTQLPDKVLIECLEVYFNLNREKFISSNLSQFSESLKKDGKNWDLNPLDTKKINSSYNTIFRMLNDELNLKNPRTFLYFSKRLKEIWPGYFESVLKKYLYQDFSIHTAFLILIAYIFYPTKCEQRTFNNNYGNDDIPEPFLKSVREHVYSITPYYVRHEDNYIKTYKLNDVIPFATLFFNPYPDILRKSKENNELGVNN